MQDEDKKEGTVPLSQLAEPIVSRRKEVEESKVITAFKGEPRSVVGTASKEKYRRKIICYLKAIGFKNKDIKATLNCSLSEVYKVLKSESAQEEIERVQREIFVAEPAKMFEAILPEAVKVAVNAMMSKKVNTSIRVDAAFKFMDRALGKPSQQVEVSHNLLKDLIQKMDSGTENATIEADFDLMDTEIEQKETK
jgi:hypothetical protein